MIEAPPDVRRSRRANGRCSQATPFSGPGSHDLVIGGSRYTYMQCLKIARGKDASCIVGESLNCSRRLWATDKQQNLAEEMLQRYSFILVLILSFYIVMAKKGSEHLESSTSEAPSSTSHTASDESNPSTTSAITVASSLSASPTSSSPSSTSSNSPSLYFDSPANTTTCNDTTFSWKFEGQTSVPLTIQITNSFSVQNAIAPGYSRAMVSFRTLTTDVPSTAAELEWSPVDVDEGSYTAVAFDTSRAAGIFAQSSPFFVASGNNRTCLANSSSTSSPSNTSSPSSSSRSSTGKHLSRGALAGTIAGLASGVIILFLAFSVPRLLRHHLPTRRNRRPGGPYYLF